ncbi:MAG: NAD(P)-binding domain-containing protein [Pseudonocardiaceae bacterium]
MATRNPMQLGVVGLGRMGANIVRRLMRDGHRCVVYDVNPDAVTALKKKGATGSSSVAEFIGKLSEPRVAWVMVPAGEVTGKTIEDLAAHMASGDTIIDGGNSYYRDDIRVVERLGPIFATIAPGMDSVSRTPGRTGEPDPAEHGFLYCGPNGAGHYFAQRQCRKTQRRARRRNRAHGRT